MGPVPSARLRLVLGLLAGFLAWSALLWLGPSPIAAAGILRVSVGGSTTNSSCGASWSNTCNLQYALTARAMSGDEIWVAAGTYAPTTGTTRTVTLQLRSGIALYGGFAMTETARSERNWTTHVVTLTGDIGTVGDTSDNAYRVVTGSGTDSTAILDGFVITAGYANDSYAHDSGAGMYISGGSPTLTNVTFSGNSAVNIGGGMYIAGGSPALTNVTFSSNSADYLGGGMGISSGSPTLTNVTFSGNSADYGGGGMYNHTGSPTLTDVTFSSNSAGNCGGGMYNDAGSPTLSNATFSGNSADSGGGMGNGSGGINLTNVTFSGNTASYYGGGMQNIDGSLTLANAILWGNTAPSGGPAIHNYIDAPVVLHGIVQGGCPSRATCTNVSAADPLLGALGGYGGSVPTIPLLPGSPAIDAGDASACPSTDARGAARPQGAGCDLGAFEARGWNLAKTAGDGQSAAIGTAFAVSLTVQVSSLDTAPADGGVIVFTAPASGAGATPLSTTVTISNSVASVTVTANSTIGAYPISATTNSAVTIFALTNVAASTTTTITGHSATTSHVGEAITVTYSVASSFGTPTGAVTVSDGASLCSATVADGQCSLTLLTAGTRILTATYAGDASFAASTSAGVTQTVTQAATTLSLAADANPAVYGQSRTFTATVACTACSSGPPTGTVTFTLGSTSLGSASLANGSASIASNTVLTAGTYSVTAQYGGSDNYGSSSASGSYIVNTASTTTTLASSASSSLYGNSVTLTATVAVLSPGAGTPSGTLTLYEVTAASGSGARSAAGARTARGAATLVNGQATITLPSLSRGTHSYLAVYEGSTNHAGSTSSTLAQVVSAATYKYYSPFVGK